MLLKIMIVLAAVVAMEGVAWIAHKYIMHGWGWNWHEDHHKPHFEKEGFFEKNDLFFVVFAIPSATSFIVGSLIPAYLLLIYVGLGILIYGVIYFLIHVILNVNMSIKQGICYWMKESGLKENGSMLSPL